MSEKPPPDTSFDFARSNDATVNKMLKHNAPLVDIIGVLAHQKTLYEQRIMELESIAPRKIVMPDGKVMLWQCPLELVPNFN